jgi:hypothetical protein
MLAMAVLLIVVPFLGGIVVETLHLSCPYLLCSPGRCCSFFIFG